VISRQEEEYILGKAYIPEHIVPLMVGISMGEPYFRDDYFFLVKDDLLIFIGYPLENDFREKFFASTLRKAIGEFRPAHTWFIVPEGPESFFSVGQRREKDEYFRLDLRDHKIKGGLKRSLEKASQNLTVHKNRSMSPEHLALTQEFLEKEDLSPRVKELYRRIPSYLAHSKTSLLLSARDGQENLSAYYVLELGAKTFATYVSGCFSRKHYVPHASDLLFLEMTNVAKENKKEYVHLGLGVNEGIRRFKKKWGGMPSLAYEFWEIISRPRGLLFWIQALQGKI